MDLIKNSFFWPNLVFPRQNGTRQETGPYRSCTLKHGMDLRTARLIFSNHWLRMDENPCWALHDEQALRQTASVLPYLRAF